MRFSTLTRTRRGRVLLATVPTVAALVALGGGVANGEVPVSMAVSGGTFKIAASSLEGTGFSQYAGYVKKADDTKVPVAYANIKQADLHDLCQSVKVGPLSLFITAGKDPKHPVTASDMQISMEKLGGDATFGAIRIGVDASTVNTAAKGAPGGFAMDADSVNIANLQQTSWSTTASTFTLNGLDLAINFEGKECF